MAMSTQEQLNPYLNRFTILVQQHATAKLEFRCLDGKVTVNLSHDLEVVEKAPPATAVKQSGQVLQKNVSLSHIIRLQKRAAERAEKVKILSDQAKAKNESEKVSNKETKAAESAKSFEKTTVEAIEAKSHAEKAKFEAEKAKSDAEEAKVEAKKTVYNAGKAKNMAEKA